MGTDYNALPRLATIEAALEKTTELLAREVACPTYAVPEWSELEWKIAEAAAVMHGICAELCNYVSWRSPDRWQCFLAEQRRQTALRWQIASELLDRIDHAMRLASIHCIALKGSALYRLGLYPDATRALGDIDLWVAAQDMDAGSHILTELGYEESSRTWRHRIFTPRLQAPHNRFGEHTDNPFKIELHSRIAERLPVTEVDITASLFPSRAEPGINPYRSNAAMMRHVLLHAAGNMRARALRFNQLHDIKLLAARMSILDWSELLREDAETFGLWWAFAPLALTARYYAGAIPSVVIDAASKHCPQALRWVSGRHLITDVSWSKLRIQAFPGIEWSRSWREACVFIRSRIFPDRASLTDLHRGATQPYMSAVPWYGLSHASRILRWVFSYPPRVQTIYPVKLALGRDR